MRVGWLAAVLAMGVTVAAQKAPPEKVELVYYVCSPRHTVTCATAPRATYAPLPNYTEYAREKNIQGQVRLYVLITPKGTTDDIEIDRSVEPGLDEAARAAVKQWRFEPARYKGKPVPVRVYVDVNFGDGSAKMRP